MNSFVKLMISGSSILALNLLYNSVVSYYLMLTLVLIYTVKQYSLMNLMILLELMTLNLMSLYFTYSDLSNHEHWNIFFILVFSASEASLGLAILVYLSRAWGEMFKLNSFNWLCSLMKP